MALGNATAASRAARETQGTNTSTGAVVSYIFNNCTTASAASTGSASALPTDPAGYVEVVIGGNVVKIPYYNV